MTLHRKDGTTAALAVPTVHAFYDDYTSSIQYIVEDPVTRACAIVDPVLDFDEKAGRVSTASADRLLSFLRDQGLNLEWILDTHPHADHFSAAHYLREKTGVPTAIGEKVVDIQKLWRTIYNMPQLRTDGSDWDHLFADGETFSIGELEGRVMFSPGHTMASITYVIGDAAFIHDTLFMPDTGSARADFPGGNATQLWHSIQAILSLPPATRLFTGHDYQPGGRKPLWESSVAEQLSLNPHVSGITQAAFVELRQTRDATLPIPRLMLHALQVNLRGGRLPDPESNGERYLKIPLGSLDRHHTRPRP